MRAHCPNARPSRIPTKTCFALPCTSQSSTVRSTPMTFSASESASKRRQRFHIAHAAAAAGGGSCRVLTAQEAPSALDGIKTVILDCDGVLWRGNTVLPGVPDALRALRGRGVRLLFVTNNSSKSREQYVAKFSSMGLAVEAKEIVSSSYAAAAYIAETLPARARVLVFGNPGMYEEMQQLNVDYRTPADVRYCCSAHDWDLEEFVAERTDSGIAAVVVGFQPDFSYRHLCYASATLREVEGCLFVATNPDAGDRVGDEGRVMPGTGCLVQAVQMSSGRTPVMVGKGGNWLLPFLCRKFDLKPNEVCVIGDRLDTDVALGKEGGLRTVLPLTGVTTIADLDIASHCELPDFVVPDFAAVAGVLSADATQS